MLEDPSVAVGDEHGVESGGQRGVDVGLGAVADHPGGVVLEFVFVSESGIDFCIFLGNDFDGREVFLDSGALDFSRLLGRCAFCDEDQAVAHGEVLQSFGNFGDELDGMIFNDVSEAADLCPEFGSDWGGTETLEGVDEGVGEAVQSVSVLNDAFALDVVQDFADLLGRELVMIQEGDEFRDGSLEVDIVFPERVVGVDEESLDAFESVMRRGSWHELAMSHEL